MTMAITNYGREVAGTLTRRADSSPGWMQGGVVVGILDLMGGKPGCAFGDGAGKGALVKREVAPCLGTSLDQTLFLLDDRQQQGEQQDEQDT